MNWQSPAAANQRSDNPVIQIDENRIVSLERWRWKTVRCRYKKADWKCKEKNVKAKRGSQRKSASMMRWHCREPITTAADELFLAESSWNTLMLSIYGLQIWSTDMVYSFLSESCIMWQNVFVHCLWSCTRWCNLFTDTGIHKFQSYLIRLACVITCIMSRYGYVDTTLITATSHGVAQGVMYGALYMIDSADRWYYRAMGIRYITSDIYLYGFTSNL